MKAIPCKCGKAVLIFDDKHEKLFCGSKTWSCNGKTIHDNVMVNGIMVSQNMGNYIITVPEGMEVDHKDRNIHNMQESNLRPATRSQQIANTGIRSDNTSGYKGVRLLADRPRTNPWEALVTKNNVSYRKAFSTAEDAARWRDRKAIELFGEFAFTNFPKEQYENI